MILALFIVSFILLVLASFNVPSGPVNIGWLGMAFFVLTFIWGKF